MTSIFHIPANTNVFNNGLTVVNGETVDNLVVTGTLNATGATLIGISGGSGGSTPIVDNLASSSITSALSANQGRILNNLAAQVATTSQNGTVRLSDLAINTAPTSTSTTLVPTMNALTVTYNKLNSQISPIDNNASFTSSISDTNSPSTLAVKNAISNKNVFNSGISITGGGSVDNLTINGALICNGNLTGVSPPPVDNLTSTSTYYPLSANQGRILNNLISTSASTTQSGVVQLADLATNVAPTSTSIIQAPTMNALTNAYNKINSQISGLSGNTIVNNASYSGSSSDTQSASVLAVKNAISNKTAFNSGISITGGGSVDNLTITGSLNCTGATLTGISGGGSTTVVDNLASTSTTSALSANQGRILNTLASATASTSQSGMVQLADLGTNVAPTSTSIVLAPTMNALTNAYNKINSQISGISGTTVVNNASYSGSSSDSQSPSVLAVKTALSSAFSPFATINIGNSTFSTQNLVNIGAADGLGSTLVQIGQTSGLQSASQILIGNGISTSGNANSYVNIGGGYGLNTVSIGSPVSTISIYGGVNLNGTTIPGGSGNTLIGNSLNSLSMYGNNVYVNDTTTGNTTIGNSTGNLNLVGNSILLNGTSLSSISPTTANSFGTSSTVTTTINVGTLTYTPTINLNALSINLITKQNDNTALINIGNNASSQGTVNIATLNGASSKINIGNASSTLNIKGSAYNIPNNTYPPTSTVATDTASANVVTQVYNLANTAVTTANNALSLTTLSSSVNIGNTASGAVTVGLSGQNMILQGITNPIALQVAFSDETTTIDTTGKYTVSIRSPYNFNIRSGSLPLFSVNTVGLLNQGGSGAITNFDIKKNGTSIYLNASSLPRVSAPFSGSPTNIQYTSAGWYQGTLLNNPTIITQYDLITISVATMTGTGNTMTGCKCIITAS